MESDIRYTFLDTLDHLPSDLVRSLWTIQGLELRADPQRDFVDQEAVKEAQHLERLLHQHQQWLQFQTEEMQEMAAIRARYEAYENAQSHKKHSTQQQLEQQPEPLKIKINLRPSHPAEPVYCICREVSYGAMIACDNSKCPIEWFHYGCIGLTQAPQGTQKWYCSERCRLQAAKKKWRNAPGIQFTVKKNGLR